MGTRPGGRSRPVENRQDHLAAPGQPPDGHGEPREVERLRRALAFKLPALDEHAVVEMIPVHRHQSGRPAGPVQQPHDFRRDRRAALVIEGVQFPDPARVAGAEIEIRGLQSWPGQSQILARAAQLIFDLPGADACACAARALIAALDAAGVELIGEGTASEGGGRGVRLKR